MTGTIAFIGFGEAGQAISAGLRQARAEPVRAYDLLYPDSQDAARLAAAAESAGISLADGVGEALAGADIVISAVTASQSVAAAESAAPHIAPGAIYLDINSTSPLTKRAASAPVEAAGARFVEAAVMATVPGYGHKVPMLLAGAVADELAATLRTFGMSVEAVGARIGEASSIKMFRSVMVKGLEALFVECLSAAETAGVSDRVLASLAESYPTVDWDKLATYHVGRVALHAKRRAAEMREATATLAEIGIEPIMAEATARLLERCADAGLREQFGATPPASYQAFVAALRAAHGAAAKKGAA